MSQSTNFVTVVAVRTGEQEGNKENINLDANTQGYVTVLTISDTENNNKTLKGITEEVIVYRLPGEKLGFGLKFEGGTKANEFVKRLFIQSCAADSPASRVQSSWGRLTEGDEVLEIDGISVNSMTRIDCVRCLKDSNVAIKLLVRHLCDNTTENKGKISGASEERRVPPVPPPVPPRKIHRKMLKNVAKEPVEVHQESKEKDVTIQPATNKPPKKLQHSRSMRAYYSSPDTHRRVRRFSDGNIGPPDAGVYTDLISQESTQSLSESDDTESTISTVIDKFGSVPNTTTSSFAGSLPSTPTSVQKKLDVSNLTVYDDEETTVTKPPSKPTVQNREENNNVVDEVDPLCFQDAPLSYGDENTKILVLGEANGTKEETTKEEKHPKKPPVPPRSKTTMLTTVIDTNGKEPNKSENLPRLVDFVPKATNSPRDSPDNSTEIMKLFLENERHKTNVIDYKPPENDSYRNGIDMYCSKWSLSFQLATIGEVEEESGSDFNIKHSVMTTPVVIVESADGNNEKQPYHNGSTNISGKESDGMMSTPPSDSRQPPDGHEFPDFVEDTNVPQQKYFKETQREPTFTTFTTASLKPSAQKQSENLEKPSNLTQVSSTSNTDLRSKLYDSAENLSSDDSIPDPVILHRRSQSLINMSTLSKEKNAKWNQLIEQRKRGMSKLKGLVIPEASEADTPHANPIISLPEIKSHTPALIQVPKENYCANTEQVNSNFYTSHNGINDPLQYSVLSPPWSVDSPSNIPKYSPAFKRKSLQVYTKTNVAENCEFVPECCDKSSPSPCPRKVNDEDMNPPKSLESISSPTRSDCSFDYSCFSKKNSDRSSDSMQKSVKGDESDNDSAVSSSHFSYNSRFSPPPSPTKSCDESPIKKIDEDDGNVQNRLLKPFSIEAINRKNILASAKCRSGKDFKIGSPVIKRKTEEDIPPDSTEQPPEKPPDGEPAVIEEKEEEEVKVRNINNETEKDVEETECVEVKPVQDTPKETRLTETKTLKVTDNAKIATSRAISRSSNDLSTLKSTSSIGGVEEAKQSKYTRDLYGSSSILNRNHKPINVKVLKENFESFGSSPAPMPQRVVNYKLPSVTKNVKAEISMIEKNIPPSLEIKKAKSVENIKPSQAKMFERRLVEKVEKFERPSCQDTNVLTLVLTLESLDSNLGIVLAGGTEENKEITVHRIRYGSVAYSDGRLKKGDKILSINGKFTKGLTHAEATEMLKEKTKKFVFQVKEGIESVPSSGLSRRSSSVSSIYSLPEVASSHVEAVAKKPTNVITFTKDDSGFGFSIEGGKDSLKGDMPLVVKKIFTGGAAGKNGELKVGDELIYINDINVTNLTRIEAWNTMKKIPNGVVTVHVYR